MFVITDNLLRETPTVSCSFFIVVGLIINIINNAIKKKLLHQQHITLCVEVTVNIIEDYKHIKVIKHLYTKTCKCLA